MIKIAIVDDNHKCIDDIKNLLADGILHSKCETYEYLTSESFLASLDDIQFDIVFLDIILGNKDGIELGCLINDKQPLANIIFVSANPEYFRDVYKVKHSYFLTKDIEKERFDDAISKAVKNLHRDYIMIHAKNESYRLNLNQIAYFESSLKHTKAHMSDGNVLEYNVNLKDIEANLYNRDFIRVHKSFIVNLNHIKKYSRQSIFFDSDMEIPISRSYMNAVKEKITLYLGETI